MTGPSVKPTRLCINHVLTGKNSCTHSSTLDTTIQNQHRIHIHILFILCRQCSYRAHIFMHCSHCNRHRHSTIWLNCISFSEEKITILLLLRRVTRPCILYRDKFTYISLFTYITSSLRRSSNNLDRDR